MLWSSTQTQQNYHQLVISQFSPSTVFSELALWRHHSSICDVTRMRGIGIVTSWSSIILAHANWCTYDIYSYEGWTLSPETCVANQPEWIGLRYFAEAVRPRCNTTTPDQWPKGEWKQKVQNWSNVNNPQGQVYRGRKCIIHGVKMHRTML